MNTQLVMLEERIKKQGKKEDKLLRIVLKAYQGNGFAVWGINDRIYHVMTQLRCMINEKQKVSIYKQCKDLRESIRSLDAMNKVYFEYYTCLLHCYMENERELSYREIKHPICVLRHRISLIMEEFHSVIQMIDYDRNSYKEMKRSLPCFNEKEHFDRIMRQREKDFKIQSEIRKAFVSMNKVLYETDKRWGSVLRKISVAEERRIMGDR